MSEDIAILRSVQAKLRPERFPGMSGRMAAIVAHVLGLDPATDPAIVELITTSDGFVLARNKADCGFNQFIGAYSDYMDNWERLIATPEVGLTEDETIYVRQRYYDAAHSPQGG